MKRIYKYLILILFIGFISGCSANNAEFDCSANKYEKTPVATVVVKDYGTMEFELFINQAPQTVASFTALANDGFYDGLTFHRLDKQLGIIQGGDPDGTGTGGPGYTIKGEFKDNNHCNNHKNELGTIAMARSQEKDSAGSQFFINFKDNTNVLSMPGNDYAVFGKVIKGQDVLDKLAKAQESQTMPNPKIVIESIKVNTFDQEMPEFTKGN